MVLWVAGVLSAPREGWSSRGFFMSHVAVFDRAEVLQHGQQLLGGLDAERQQAVTVPHLHPQVPESLGNRSSSSGSSSTSSQVGLFPLSLTLEMGSSLGDPLGQVLVDEALGELEIPKKAHAVAAELDLVAVGHEDQPEPMALVNRDTITASRSRCLPGDRTEDGLSGAAA